MHDIIPDIHGQAEKLRGALTNLGYRELKGAWRHSDPNRSCVFLGDFIDRGPQNAAVIDIVRRMIDAGSARAIMGNHELNAIHFHTLNPETGLPLRERSVKNYRQHDSFLTEFAIDDPATKDAINWMRTLPLFLEINGFRAVHACWDEARIAALKSSTSKGVLSEEQLLQAAHPGSELFDWVEATTKGPEHPLPDGYTITDKDGTVRSKVRLKWWQQNATSWADIAISVPNISELPLTAPPEGVLATTYRSDARPVFFGHYWLEGKPRLQSANALCLDYSAGKEGPLVTYTFDGSDADRLINQKSIDVH